MNVLNVSNLSMSFGADVLYEGVGFGLDDGERVAVIGPNGCGKSTLFQLLAGERIPDDGEITVRSGTSVGYLGQDPSFEPGTTCRQVVARAMEPVRKALAEFTRVSESITQALPPEELEELLSRQAELEQRIRNSGGWNWEHHVEEMLDRLGVSAYIDTPINQLSGGQRRRVALARVLAEGPDLLLLDEPTNHLDEDAVDWLEGWLRERPGTLMLVTHDRYFLENVVGRILEVDSEGFYDYPGNFETFMERRRHRLAIRERTEKRQKKLLDKELDWLGGSAKSQYTKSKKRIQDVEELREELKGRRPFVDRRMVVEIPEPPEFGDQILSALGVWKRFDEKVLFEKAHLSLRPGDKVGLLGPNGAGKSTLLEMLTGRERPDAGQIICGDKTEIAYLRQDSPNVDPKATVYEAMSESDYVWIGGRKLHKRDYLDGYLFDKHLQRTQVGMLSGGQRRRLALARVVAQHANLLILDEPTNDLDIMSLHALETALSEFEGCVLVVSHDRFFLNRVCTSIVAIEDGRLERYEGNYDDYRRKRASRVVAEPERPAKAKRDRRPPVEPAKVLERPGLTYGEEERLKELEGLIEEVEERRTALEAELGDPDLYRGPRGAVEELNRALRGVKEELQTLFDEWAALEEKRSE